MSHLTNAELDDVHALYGLANGNCAAGLYTYIYIAECRFNTTGKVAFRNGDFAIFKEFRNQCLIDLRHSEHDLKTPCIYIYNYVE
ncbi:hypothetical protein CEXT_747651 [Caerostris extrusa]|uniref:Uncharacterized protein n=1 Tax=Caerostris extrusa TaxID=172846 RepID=A0AAV4T4S7_CAEEX|nr:hypothetical protein CEXT_747651 [Caerostris extrusa]